MSGAPARGACDTCGVVHEGEHVFRYAEPDRISKQFIDPITFEPLFDAVELPCQHTFSKANIETWLAQNGTCPLDKKAFRVSDLKPVTLLVRSLLSELRVMCPNANLGCVTSCERDGLSAHLKECPLATISCTNSFENFFCEAKFLRKDAGEHGKACGFRLSPCGLGCGKNLRAADMEAHSCIAHFAQQLASVSEQQARTAAELAATKTELAEAKVQIQVLLSRNGVAQADTARGIPVIFPLQPAVNSDGAPVYLGSGTCANRLYCGRRGQYICEMGCDGTCGRNNGCACRSCEQLNHTRGTPPYLHLSRARGPLRRCQCLNGQGRYRMGAGMCDTCRGPASGGYHACPDHDCCAACWQRGVASSVDGSRWIAISMA